MSYSKGFDQIAKRYKFNDFATFWFDFKKTVRDTFGKSSKLVLFEIGSPDVLCILKKLGVSFYTIIKKDSRKEYIVYNNTTYLTRYVNGDEFIAVNGSLLTKQENVNGDLIPVPIIINKEEYPYIYDVAKDLQALLFESNEWFNAHFKYIALGSLASIDIYEMTNDDIAEINLQFREIFDDPNSAYIEVIKSRTEDLAEKIGIKAGWTNWVKDEGDDENDIKPFDPLDEKK